MSKAPVPSPAVSARPQATRPLGFLLRQAAAAHRLKVDRALADIDVTAPQMLMLTTIDHGEGLSNADLARATLLTTATVSVVVGHLLRRGALSRSPHPFHGRVQQLSLTEAGRVLLRSCQKRVRPIEQELEKLLDLSEVKNVEDWLNRTIK